MRADKGALVTLGTAVRLPDRHLQRDAALLPGGGAGGKGAVFHSGEGAHRQQVATLAVHGLQDIADEVRHQGARLRCRRLEGRPVGGYRHPVQRRHPQLDSPLVHLNDARPFAAIAFLHRLLEIVCRRLRIDNRRQLKERRLHQHVKAPTEAQLAGNVHRIKGIKVDLFLRQIAPDADRQVLLQLCLGPAAVEQKGASWLQPLQQVVAVDIGLLRAGDKIGPVDQVGRGDRPVAKAQVRNGDPPGLFRVVGKVGLGVEWRVIADDLDGAFVRPDGAVRAHPPEFTGGDPGMGDRQRFLPGGQRGKSDIIDNTQGKAVLRLRLPEVVKHRGDIVGQHVLTAERVAAADDQRRIVALIEGVLDVEAQRFRLRPRLFGAVKDGNTLHAAGQLREKVRQRERPIEMDAEQPHLLPRRIQRLHHLLDGVAH